MKKTDIKDFLRIDLDIKIKFKRHVNNKDKFSCWIRSVEPKIRLVISRETLVLITKKPLYNGLRVSLHNSKHKREFKEYHILSNSEDALIGHTKQEYDDFNRDYDEEEKILEENLNYILNSNDRQHSSDDNFTWGGLSGEEAHLAMWNCD